MRASDNPELKQDVIGEIGTDTIILRLPKGTNVTALKPSIDFGYSYSTSLPSAFWSGNPHDFTNPVIYTLTAPDGVTKKSYTAQVEFYDSAQGVTTPTPKPTNTPTPKPTTILRLRSLPVLRLQDQQILRFRSHSLPVLQLQDLTQLECLSNIQQVMAYIR